MDNTELVAGVGGQGGHPEAGVAAGLRVQGHPGPGAGLLATLSRHQVQVRGGLRDNQHHAGGGGAPWNATFPVSWVMGMWYYNINASIFLLS